MHPLKNHKTIEFLEPMDMVDHLISTLDMNASVHDIRQVVFHTAVLTRNCRLAATLPHDTLRQNQPLVKEPGCLLDKTPLELVNMGYRKVSLKRPSIPCWKSTSHPAWN
jgi:hypothetical protein